MSTVTAPRAAVLGPVRDWLRDTTAVATLCGTDTTLTEPSIYAGGLATSAVLPAVVLTKVGLGADGTTTENHLVQFDCWASKADGAADAEALAAAVKTALESATGVALGASSVRLLGAQIEAEVALPDPDDGTPRYVVTATLTTTVVS
jgi:hypothetical protein